FRAYIFFLDGCDKSEQPALFPSAHDGRLEESVTAKSSELNWDIVERNRKIRACKSLRNGGATRDRTDDLIVATLWKERGPAVTKRSKQLTTWRRIRQLRSLGYRIDPPNPPPSQGQA